MLPLIDQKPNLVEIISKDSSIEAKKDPELAAITNGNNLFLNSNQFQSK